MTRVVFVGVAAYDAIASVAAFPEPDSRVDADAIVHAGGGPAATAAVACTRLGYPASFVGAVGDDTLGDAILSGLRTEDVDVSGVMRASGPSGSSVIVVDRARGTRAICNRPGPVFAIPVGSRAEALIAGADWVHVDQMGWGTLNTGHGGLLSVDAGNPITGYAPRGTALFVPTLQRLRAMFGARPTPTLLRAALDAGAECVVATDGGNGSFAATRAKAWHVPALRHPILSTLGAGDVFHGALLAATLHGLDVPSRTAYANIAAALSCRGLDGRSAIPRHDEVMALLPTLTPLPLEQP